MKDRELLDNIPMGLYRTSPDGRFLMANAALVALLDYPDLDTLLAAPGAGATELLRQAYDRLFRQHGAASPVYFQWSRHDRTASVAARRFLHTFFALHHLHGAVVELGPYLGGTTRAIATGMERAGSSGPLVSLDAFEWHLSLIHI